MNLTREIKSKIMQHAKDEAPKECCGFVLEGGAIYQAKNASSDKNRFKISAEDYVAAASIGGMQAIYHSHPTTEPKFSEFDKFNSISHDILYILYSLKDNSFTQFDPSLSTFHKYIGRSFEIGKTDCFALIRDFYKDEFDIELKDYFRDKKWKSNLEQLFDSNFATEGFFEVDDPQKYDCILLGLKKDSPSGHIALYLGNNLMLHQPEKNYSRVEEYSEKHKRLTNHIIRHKGWTWMT